MQVLAFSTTPSGGWRWRIVNYGGEMLEESRGEYPTIAAAVVQGRERLTEMNVQDISRMDRSFIPRRRR
jgi:hypothetical protein